MRDQAKAVSIIRKLFRYIHDVHAATVSEIAEHMDWSEEDTIEVLKTACQRGQGLMKSVRHPDSYELTHVGLVWVMRNDEQLFSYTLQQWSQTDPESFNRMIGRIS